MLFANISLRWLTALTATCVVVCFVVFYLTFKYFWSFEREMQHARMLQRAETKRVETVIALEKEEMGSSMADYAAWNDMADYIENPDPSFITDSIGIHAFTSKALDGIFIFTPESRLVWGMSYDIDSGQQADYRSFIPYFPVILGEPQRASQEYVDAKVRFVVIDQEPYLAATSRVCNSKGLDCDKGFLIFMKKVRSQFESVVEQATGIDIDVLSRAPYTPLPVSEPDVTYLETIDFDGRSSVLIKLWHQVKLPGFIRSNEIIALVSFSILLFFVSLLMVGYLVRPITRANMALESFKASRGKMPDEKHFFSREMQDFARTINRIFSELEESRTQLRWQSEHDPLTRISNRRKLERELKSFIGQLQYPWLAVYLIDVDYFKLYNDHYGHLKGDKVLKAVAGALEQVDFAGTKVVARFGGEEFCVALASDMPLDSVHYAAQLCELIHQLAIPHQASPLADILTVSVGGVLASQAQPDDYQQLFHDADKALYQAKQAGRDGYVVTNWHHNKQKHHIS